MTEPVKLLVQVHVDQDGKRVCVDGWEQPSSHPTPLVGDVILNKSGPDAVQRRVVFRIWDRRRPPAELHIDTIEVGRWPEPE